MRRYALGAVYALLLFGIAPVMGFAADEGQAAAGTNDDRSVIHTAFDEGMSAYDAGKYDVAASKFEQVLQLDPTHDRARLELGRTYFAQERFEDARREFVTVLKNNPPDAVKMNIQLFLDRIERETKRFNFDLRLSGGVFYDDNVNVGPASDLIHIRPTSFGGATINTLAVNPASQPQASWGVFAEGSAYGQYDIGERGDWLAIGGVDYYQTWLDQHTDREILYGDVFGGFAHLTKSRVINIPVRIAHIEEGNDPLVNIIGLAPSYNTACDKDVLCSTALVGEYHDYDVNERDSYYGELRHQIVKLFDERRKSVTAALGAFYEDADQDIYSNYGVLGILGGSVSLPWRSRFDVRGSYRGSWYDKQEALAPDNRQDNELQGQAELSHQIDENWSVALLYQYTQRQSTFDLYDYDRNFVNLRIDYAY